MDSPGTKHRRISSSRSQRDRNDGLWLLGPRASHIKTVDRVDDDRQFRTLPVRLLIVKFQARLTKALTQSRPTLAETRPFWGKGLCPGQGLLFRER